jgi:hypothetical protein
VRRLASDSPDPHGEWVDDPAAAQSAEQGAGLAAQATAGPADEDAASESDHPAEESLAEGYAQLVEEYVRHLRLQRNLSEHTVRA